MEYVCQGYLYVNRSITSCALRFGLERRYNKHQALSLSGKWCSIDEDRKGR